MDRPEPTPHSDPLDYEIPEHQMGVAGGIKRARAPSMSPEPESKRARYETERPASLRKGYSSNGSPRFLREMRLCGYQQLPQSIRDLSATEPPPDHHDLPAAANAELTGGEVSDDDEASIWDAISEYGYDPAQSIDDANTYDGATVVDDTSDYEEELDNDWGYGTNIELDRIVGLTDEVGLLQLAAERYQVQKILESGHKTLDTANGQTTADGAARVTYDATEFDLD
ncbi:hypothetical protein EJ06DRAFT_89904 [Trichodelitschia bisporula]|uniref:Uncharacterized protein n=1 Tax=Trichodelitschia bisporula TaxID=703511 RepID=A0A6G1HSM0_9PEZI|nr:hypothetical protein EJ06DRAFT_89904 [Trichodelitschia bisporula]